MHTHINRFMHTNISRLKDMSADVLMGTLLVCDAYVSTYAYIHTYYAYIHKQAQGHERRCGYGYAPRQT